MLLKQVLDLFEVLDTPQASGETVKKMLLEAGADEVKVQTVTGDQGFYGLHQSVDLWPQRTARRRHGADFGYYRRLGGLGARPEVWVSPLTVMALWQPWLRH